MLHGMKLRCRRAADALRRRIRRHDLGMLPLERDELLHQPIVLGVRNLRLVGHVVAVIQGCELRAQLVGAFHGGASAGGAAAPASSARIMAMRAAVSASPRSSCSAPCRRSFNWRALESNSSKACGAGNGPGRTAKTLSPP